jgi:hypothetical protein
MAAQPQARLLGVGQWHVTRPSTRVVGLARLRTAAATATVIATAVVTVGWAGARLGPAPAHQQRRQQHQDRDHEQWHDRDQTSNGVRLTGDWGSVPRLGGCLQGSTRR